MRNVEGTTPEALPEWNPFGQDLHRQRSTDIASKGGGEPQGVIASASRVEAHNQIDLTQPLEQGLDMGGQVRTARLLGRLDQYETSTVGPS